MLDLWTWVWYICVQLSEELSGSSCHNESATRQRQTKVEDILVKMIRLVANVSISADFGQQLAYSDSMLDLLVHVISMYWLYTAVHCLLIISPCVRPGAVEQTHSDSWPNGVRGA